MKMFFVVIFLSVGIFINYSVFADDKKVNIKVNDQMPDIIVTADRIEEKTKEITANVTVINKEDINASTAKDLGQLLSEKAGVLIREYPGTLTQIGIRGFRTEIFGNDLIGKVLILMDGRRVATGNAAKIKIKNISKIEIIRGPAAVQYASAAIGGIINVITKKGSTDTEMFTDIKLGSFEYEEYNAGFSAKKNSIDISASLTKSSMGDYRIGSNGDKSSMGDNNDTIYYNTGYKHKANFSINMGYEFLKDHRIGLIYTFFDAEEVGDSGYISSVDKDDYKNIYNKSFDISYEGVFLENFLSYKARYYGCEDKDSYYDPSDHDFFGWDDDIPYISKTSLKGYQVQFSLNSENFILIAGADMAYYLLESTSAPFESDYLNNALFILGKYMFLDHNFIVTAGIRYEAFKVEIINPDRNIEEINNVNQSIGIAYNIIDGIKTRINYSKGFRIPDVKELAFDYTSGSGQRTVGNSDLDPESSDIYEIGVDIGFEFFSSSITYFYTSFIDKIVSCTNDDGDKSYENLGGSVVSGFEITFDYIFRHISELDFNIKPYINLTYLDQFYDNEENKNLQYTPFLKFSGGVQLNSFNGFSANLNIVYTAEQNITDYQNGIWPDYGDTILDSSLVVNLKASYSFDSIKIANGLTVYGEITNFFDEYYEYVQGYPLPGRSYFIGITINI